MREISHRPNFRLRFRPSFGQKAGFGFSFGFGGHQAETTAETETDIEGLCPAIGNVRACIDEVVLFILLVSARYEFCVFCDITSDYNII